MATGGNAGKERLHFSAEQWAERLDAWGKGSADGRKEVPPERENTLSQSEREIIREFEGNIRQRAAEVRKRIDEYRSSLARIFNDTVLEDLRGLPRKLATFNADSRAEHRERLGLLRRECRDRRNDLAEFKNENDLRREAKPKTDPMILLMWVAGIVTVETALNATFFAAGSDRGLMGGAIQAFVISFINVYTAWIGGRHCWPRLNHVDATRRTTGIVACLMVGGIIVSLNLFAGHYRSALEQDPFSAVVQAVLTFADNVFGISSAQGWLLTGVGLVASTGLCIKIYSSDDPYPGFGDMTQVSQEAEEQWVAAREQFIRIIRDNYETVEQERRQKTDKLTDLELQCRRQMDLAHHVAVEFAHFCYGEESKCNHVINDYRRAFADIRKQDREALPAYFSESVSLDVEQYVMNVDLDRERRCFEAMVESFECYRHTESDAIKQRLNEIHDQAVEDLEDYFRTV